MKTSLLTGETISLDDRQDGSVTSVVMGLRWDVAKRRGFLGRMVEGAPIDLDTSCVPFDADNNKVDEIWFGQLESKDGNIVHGGYNRADDGDAEQIRVNLSALPANVKTLVFVVSSFTGHSFARIDNAMCRLVDETTGTEIARYDRKNSGGSHTAQIMAKVVRKGSGWEMKAIGQVANGRTFDALMPDMIKNL